MRSNKSKNFKKLAKTLRKRRKSPKPSVNYWTRTLFFRSAVMESRSAGFVAGGAAGFSGFAGSTTNSLLSVTGAFGYKKFNDRNRMQGRTTTTKTTKTMKRTTTTARKMFQFNRICWRNGFRQKIIKIRYILSISQPFEVPLRCRCPNLIRF